jgi:hypothetical protein
MTPRLHPAHRARPTDLSEIGLQAQPPAGRPACSRQERRAYPEHRDHPQHRAESSTTLRLHRARHAHPIGLSLTGPESPQPADHRAHPEHRGAHRAAPRARLDPEPVPHLEHLEHPKRLEHLGRQGGLQRPAESSKTPPLRRARRAHPTGLSSIDRQAPPLGDHPRHRLARAMTEPPPDPEDHRPRRPVPADATTPPWHRGPRPLAVRHPDHRQHRGLDPAHPGRVVDSVATSIAVAVGPFGCAGSLDCGSSSTPRPAATAARREREPRVDRSVRQRRAPLRAVHPELPLAHRVVARPPAHRLAHRAAGQRLARRRVVWRPRQLRRQRKLHCGF